MNGNEGTHRASHGCPGATYRLQFNAQFRFEDASGIIDYLRKLGVTHIYASPLFRSGADSTHGYDVCSYQEIDPKLGGSHDFDQLVEQLKSAGLGLLLDIVPNHMRADVANPWWRDVLEKGPDSRYACYFDIDWDSDLPNIHRKVLLPLLGATYADTLESGQIQIVFSEGSLWITYGPHRFPASRSSYVEILKETHSSLQSNGSERSAIQALLDRASAPGDGAQMDLLKSEARQLFATYEPFRAALEKCLTRINGAPGNPRSYDRLDRILQQQHYRLCWWRIGPEQIDYRRFFDITDLVCMNAQRPEVFEASHTLVRTLIERNIVSGLRIDHLDGLWNPQQYLARLADLWPVHFDKAEHFVIAEKILSGSEHLPRTWPVAGTTGYEFLNQVNGIFVDTSNKEAFTKVYRSFTGKVKSFGPLLFACRLKVLKQSFSGQLEALVDCFASVAAQTRYGRDFTAKSIRGALSNFISAFPVYRTYVNERTHAISLQERRTIERAIRESRHKTPPLDSPVLNFLRQILLLEFPPDFDDAAQAQARRFIMKLQQLTAPLAAKGLEDTACYIYNRLISLNEVGGNPGKFGVPIEDFHKANQQRGRHWQHSLVTTSTHDTKHGEDARARINVLSEQPEQWAAALNRWSELNEPAKVAINGNLAPYPNDEYRLYQALIGTWTADDSDEYRYRMVQYMLKAVREAKEHTSWIDQNLPYENVLQGFVERILSPHHNNRFLSDFAEFSRRVSFFGCMNSLSQVLLKTLSPGVPDFYQGNELWDLALVDPDNRRPVDYPKRIELLENMASRFAQTPRSDFLRELLDDLPGGAVKLFVIWRLLQLRRARPAVFDEGRYLPATILGSCSAHLCAFARTRQSESLLAVAPRLICKLMHGEARFPLGTAVWSDTRIVVPGAHPGSQFQELFSDRLLTAEGNGKGGATLRVSEILAEFPIALLSTLV